MSRRFDLIRHLKSRDVLDEDLTLAKARMYVAMCLYDNQAASKAEAQEFAASVPVDERINHPSGYGFTLTRRDAS